MKAVNVSNPIVKREYCIVQCCFWIEACLFQSYASVYLQRLGYSNAQLGLIVAFGHLLGFLIGPCAAAVVDRSEKIKSSDVNNILIFIEILSLVFLKLYPFKGAVTSVGYAMFGAFGIVVNSMNIEISIELEHSGKNANFGFARGIGSAAFVCTTISMGSLLDQFSEQIIITTALLVSFVQLALNMAIGSHIDISNKKYEKTSSPTDSMSFLAFVKEYRVFLLMLLGNSLVFFSHKTDNGYLINLVRNVGGTTKDMGYLSGFTAAIEIIPMLLYTRYKGKAQPSSLLCVAFIMFTVKSLLATFATSLAMLYISHSFQLVSFGIYTPAMVDYISRTIPYEHSTKAQSLASGTSIMGTILANLFSGRMFDVFSVRLTLGITTIVSAIGAIICIYCLQKGKNRLSGIERI